MLFLEEDPIACAKYTPVSLMKDILTNIDSGYRLSTQMFLVQEVYNDLPRAIAAMFSSSQKSYEWLVKYYNELSHLHNHNHHNKGHKEPKKFLVEPIIKTKLYLYKPLSMFDPMWLQTYLPFFNQNVQKYKDCSDIILKSRWLLAELEPSDDEFLEGIPNWYLNGNIDETVLENYDELTHTHIKIVNSFDRYRFFTSYKTDNWNEVKNVPTEISTIVRYLLTNKPLNLED